MSKPILTPVSASDPFLTTKQAAVVLGVTLRSVQFWCLDGLLNHFVTPGGHRRILQSEVARFKRERSSLGASPAGEDRAGVVLKRLDAISLVEILNRLQIDIETGSGHLTEIVREVESELAAINGMQVQPLESVDG